MERIDLNAALKRIKFDSFTSDELNELFRKENKELCVLCDTLKKQIAHEVSCGLPRCVECLGYTGVDVDIDGKYGIKQLAYDMEFYKTDGNSYVTVNVTLYVPECVRDESVRFIVRAVPQNGIDPYVVIEPGMVSMSGPVRTVTKVELLSDISSVMSGMENMLTKLYDTYAMPVFKKMVDLAGLQYTLYYERTARQPHNVAQDKKIARLIVLAEDLLHTEFADMDLFVRCGCYKRTAFMIDTGAPVDFMEDMCRRLKGDADANKVSRYITNHMTMSNMWVRDHVDLFTKVRGSQLVWSGRHPGMDNPLRDSSVKSMVREYRKTLKNK